MSNTSPDNPVVDSESQPWMERGHGQLFAVRCRRLGTAAGSKQLGCNLFELDPGKTAMPFHRHLAAEEAMFVVAGAGTLRLGERRHAVGAGDYVAFVAGGPAHQLTNTGSDPLRYLMVSTQPAVDAVEYPDSSKVGVLAFGAEPPLHSFFPADSKVDYWKGEPSGGKAPDDGSATQATQDAGSDDATAADLEAQLDAEIDALKDKLGLSGNSKAKPSAAPKKGSTARKAVDATLSELQRLKRMLDND